MAALLLGRGKMYASASPAPPAAVAPTAEVTPTCTTAAVQSRAAVITIALAAAIFCTFIGVVDCDFVQLDDSSHVYENALVRGGLTWSGIRTAFTTPHASLWVPLTTCSFMLDVSLWGLDPRWFHLENVAWHSAAAVLLFLALGKMTGRLWPSAIVAALFGLHPINVESVAWITERKNVLCAFFSMLTLHCWAHYAGAGPANRRQRLLAWLGASLALTLALLAKPMAVTVPFALLLFDAWPLRRWSTIPWPRLLAEKAPLFALSLAASRAATWAAGGRESIVTLDELPFVSRLTNALDSITAYLRQILLPSDFAVIYPHPIVAQWSTAALSLAIILAITLIAWRARATQPWLLCGWLLFVGMLVPSLGFVQVGCQARADRFTYLAQIGLFIAIVWTGEKLCRKNASRLRIPAVIAVLMTLSAISATHVRHWSDSETLFEHSLAVTGPHPQMLDLAASAHARRGRDSTAIHYWQQSLSLFPGNDTARTEIAKARTRIAASTEEE